MLFRNIKILDENFEIKNNMYVATDDDRIAYVGDCMPRGDYGDIRDGEGKLLMPAFCRQYHGLHNNMGKH